MMKNDTKVEKMKCYKLLSVYILDVVFQSTDRPTYVHSFVRSFISVIFVVSFRSENCTSNNLNELKTKHHWNDPEITCNNNKCKRFYFFPMLIRIFLLVRVWFVCSVSAQCTCMYECSVSNFRFLIKMCIKCKSRRFDLTKKSNNWNRLEICCWILSFISVCVCWHIISVHLISYSRIDCDFKWLTFYWWYRVDELFFPFHSNPTVAYFLNDTFEPPCKQILVVSVYLLFHLATF